MPSYKVNTGIKRLAVVWCVIVASATLQAVLLFGMPFDVVGSPVDMRFMLVFAACGVLGAILLTVAAYGRINAIWSIVCFLPPGLLSLYWGQAFLSQDVSFDLIIMLGLPMLAYAGGCIVGIYTSVKQQRVVGPKHVKKL